jgi:cell division protein FtsW (lipid II flippase)
MLSKKTKNNRLGYWITSILSLLLWVVPIAIFLFLALMEGTLMYQKIALSLSVLTVLILTLVALTNKMAMRSRTWVLLIGLYVCLQEIMVPIVVFACCQVADELIISPMKSRFKRKYQINKEIDSRL